jgi:hypothetical protein
VDWKTREGICHTCAVKGEDVGLNPALQKRIEGESLKAELQKGGAVVGAASTPAEMEANVKIERERRGASPRAQPTFEPPNLAIPKIFHWVWVGENPFPEKDAAWLQSWRAHHPDWRFLIWCEHPENVALEGFESVSVPPLVNQHEYDYIENWVGARAKLSARSDIVRAEVVARFGGVYLDTDVECFKPIDDLLDGVRLFIAEEWRENRTGGNGSFCFGATKNHPATWELLRWLPGKLLEETKRIQAEKKERGGNWTFLNPVDCPGPHFINEHLKKHADCVVFPHMVFNPLCAYEDPGQVEIWPEISHANHHYAGKWYDRTKRKPAQEFLKKQGEA